MIVSAAAHLHAPLDRRVLAARSPGGADTVVVAGGGPAGATTALLLARQGRRVILIEREAFPRPKPCGDCLSAAATGLLRELGLLDAVLEAGAARLSAWRVRSPSGHVCHGRFDGVSALALERRVLDAVLLDAAVRAGVTVVRGRVLDLAGAAVRFRDAEGHERVVGAGLVVGADGLRSVVARRADLVRRRPRLRKVSLTTHGAGPAGGLAHGEMHVLDGACIGLAPAGSGRFNLTLVVTHRHAGELASLGPVDFLDAWLDRALAVRDRLAGLSLDRPYLASGPFDWPSRSPVARRLALVGDAAGYYDPFTGQGIYQAMEGARLLAVALEGLSLDDERALSAGLRRYSASLRRLKAPARRVQRLVEAALAGPRRADRVLRRLAAAPAAMDRLIEVTGDLRPAAALLSPRLLSSFLFPPASEVR